MKSLLAFACLALPLLCATPLAAQTTHLITVDHSGSSLIFRQPPGPDSNGNQHAKTHDVVLWKCGKSLTSCTVEVRFIKDGKSPCDAAVGPSNDRAQCKIGVGAGIPGYVGTYKYTIKVSSNGANYETDPEIIVSN
jgi:hypothetical protein